MPSGNPAERAGLTGGKLYGTAADLGDARKKSGAQVQAASVAAGVTEWQRGPSPQAEAPE